ncbi:acyl-CoA dehydrogenase family protein [Ramlibacter tataouinensis]|uniref:acyl-CoA dehydrogenase family protein n=1 Tax=Ramlibacter tataouinensis TaxID=94132 RepID=UPI0022F39BB2|nr:acyl-CoA dehydrogenase family protein [Ramlibacter tataouinensis]WBY01333.1 acyl-CoA dehydrogenase family protein [Ramlibacter tataouinensis]
MQSVDEFADSGALDAVDHRDVDASCRRLVSELGRAGLLRACVSSAYGGFSPAIESRRLTLAREGLAYRCGLADFSLAMQGLGSGPIALEGSEEFKQAILPKVARGELIPAFALSEKEAGSNVGAMTCTAVRDGDHYVVNGEKTWISNGGIADVYTLFARTGEGPKTRGISAFVVYPDDPGFSIAERIEVMAPHPLATLRFENMRLPASRLLGKPGEGFKLAMRTLDIFRVSVAGAALGFARRAFDEALAHARSRQMFDELLGDMPVTQDRIGAMAARIDAAALLTYRAAWRRDVLQLPTTREAAMAKMAATESAQRVIDAALQLFGARGVQVGGVMESLYREIRALRIYEGATEVQKMIVAREVLKNGVSLATGSQQAQA